MQDKRYADVIGLCEQAFAHPMFSHEEFPIDSSFPRVRNAFAIILAGDEPTGVAALHSLLDENAKKRSPTKYLIRNDFLSFFESCRRSYKPSPRIKQLVARLLGELKAKRLAIQTCNRASSASELLNLLLDTFPKRCNFHS